jgi:hypothetical protein
MPWVRQDGKWVNTDNPAPAANVIPDAPADRPGRLDDLTRQFNENPHAFMKQYPLSPPDGSGIAGDIGPNIRENVLADGTTRNIALNAGERAKVILAEGGGKRFVRIMPHPAANFPGAKTLEFVPDGLTDGSTIPIQWLPWSSLKIIRHTIPAVPNNLYNPLEVDYPRIFFTAGINGCSIFIQGTPENPTVSHAGLSGSLTRAATEFWQEQLGILNPGQIRGETSTRDYMKGLNIQAQTQQFMDWLNKDKAGPARLTLLSPFGSVFGVRHGRVWTFYLQKNVVLTETLFHKESEIEKSGNRFKVRATGKFAEPAGTRLEHQHVLGHQTPWKINKKSFKSTRVVSKTMMVGEIFPRKLVSSDLQPEWRINFN